MNQLEHDKLSPEQKAELDKHIDDHCLGNFGFGGDFTFADGGTIEVSEIETYASVERYIETCGTCGYVTDEGDYDFDEDTLECVCNDCKENDDED